jgi:hypothetical protein
MDNYEKYYYYNKEKDEVIECTWDFSDDKEWGLSQERYTSLEKAKAQHDAIILKIKGGFKNGNR